jgi:cytochrome c
LEAGRRAFRVCQTCHTLGEDDRHMVGPNLHGLFSRNVGEAEDFRYSNALQEADFAWTPEQLNEWLANPRDFLPGNRMSFAGLRDEETRADVIAYLAVETHADE